MRDVENCVDCWTFAHATRKSKERSDRVSDLNVVIFTKLML